MIQVDIHSLQKRMNCFFQIRLIRIITFRQLKFSLQNFLRLNSVLIMMLFIDFSPKEEIRICIAFPTFGLFRLSDFFYIRFIVLHGCLYLQFE